MVPCDNCLVIPICRNKYFIDMKTDCSLVEQFLFEGVIHSRRRRDFSERIAKVYKSVKPLYWEVGKTNPLNAGHPQVDYFKYNKRSNKH